MLIKRWRQEGDVPSGIENNGDSELRRPAQIHNKLFQYNLHRHTVRTLLHMCLLGLVELLLEVVATPLQMHCVV